MEWLEDNAALVSALASCGMFLIWLVYAALFYVEFRRRRWPRLYLHEAGGGATASTCLLINLGREPVHVLCSMVLCDGIEVRLHASPRGGGESAVQRSKQGPLAPGESLALGSFQDIGREIESVSWRAKDGQEYEIDVCVAAVNGDARWPIGARRRFHVHAGDGRVAPAMASTEQLHSRRHSGEVRRWVDRCYDPK